jgi:hypothetical protein
VPADALLGASLTVTSEDGDIDVPVQVLFLTPEHSAVAVLPGNALPAGTHEGTLTAGESTWAAIVEMPKIVALQVFPTEVHVAIGDAAVATVDVINTGNEEVSIRRSYGVPIELPEVLTRAIVAGIGSRSGGVERWGAAADAVAESQVGVARIAVRSGSGALAAGESRRIVAAVSPPDGLDTSNSYVGTWTIENASVRLLLTVSAERGPE